jgi:hypothetical protein
MDQVAEDYRNPLTRSFPLSGEKSLKNGDDVQISSLSAEDGAMNAVRMKD